MGLEMLVQAVSNREFCTEIVEFDLALTKDGELMLLHDDTLGRTTDCAEVLGDPEALPINYAHERNIAVYYWTIDTVSQMERLRDHHVDCIITDMPDEATKVRSKERWNLNIN